ncbi:MAG TPA: hypothetical protein VGK67_39170 [Myxococcales bacterium]
MLALSAALLGCASNTLEARERRGEKRAEEVDSVLRKSEQQCEALEPEAAEKSLTRAKDLLGDEELALSPDKSLLERRYQEVVEGLPAIRAARAKRDHDLAVAERKAMVEKALSNLDGSMADLSLQKPTNEAIALSRKWLDGLSRAVVEGKALESDKAYAAWADKARKRHSDATVVVALAVDLEQFLAGPCEKLRTAREQLVAARAASEPKPRVDAVSLAVEKLKACGDEGKAMLAKNGVIGGKPLSFADGTITPTAAVAACAAELKDADKRLEIERKALAAWIKKQEAAEKARLKAEAAAKAKADAAEKARQKAEAAKAARAAKAAKAAKKK